MLAQVGLTAPREWQIAVGEGLRYVQWGDGLLLAPAELVNARARAGSSWGYRRLTALRMLMGWWCEGQGTACLADWAAVLGRIQTARLPTDAPLDDPDALAQMLTEQPEERATVLLTLVGYAAFRLQNPDAEKYTPLWGRDALSAIMASGQSERTRALLEAVYRRDRATFWHLVQAYRSRYGATDLEQEAFLAWLQTDLGLRDLPRP